MPVCEWVGDGEDHGETEAIAADLRLRNIL
jgi:hypothetical protein